MSTNTRPKTDPLGREDTSELTFAAQAPPPQLYRSISVHSAELPARLKNIVTGLEGIDEDCVGRFRELGYVVVRQAFPPEVCGQLRQGLFDLGTGKSAKFSRECAKTDQTNPILALGRGEPVLQFEVSAAQAQTAEEKYQHCRKLQNFHYFDDRMKLVTHSDPLLKIVDQLLAVLEPDSQPQQKRRKADDAKHDTGDSSAPEDLPHMRTSHPGVDIFQSLALLKPPGGREKPWHQDHAYFDMHVDTPVVGLWMALDRAVPDNGCMHVLPGRQNKNMDPWNHFKVRDWQICDSDILKRGGGRCVSVDLDPGSLMLFSSMLPHGTPPNKTKGKQRRAIQFHFCRRKAPRVDTAHRLRVFGTQGKGVQC